MYKRPDSLPYGVTEYNLAAPDVLARPTEDPISKESQTTLRETIYRHISILLSRGQRFNGADLYKTFSSYNNTLLTQDLGRVQQSLSDHSASEPLGRPLRTDLDVASEFSTPLPGSSNQQILILSLRQRFILPTITKPLSSILIKNAHRVAAGIM